MTTGDRLMDALVLLAEGGNPCFDQISFDPEQHVLSFRRAGMDEYVNVWLHGGPSLEHCVERNGGGAAQVIWRDGEFVDDERHFVFTLPGRIDPQSLSPDLRDRVQHRSSWAPVY